ncbi:SLBB domain-containing protein [Hoylesella loescheii]|jgi:polysialic acid transporter|uniref:polysaccharide biosynthesis/export family protein n=1 Tax=Hoylesella loescheii TaxID=840 RepID=UPI0028EF52F6|nr:SLBB domain-containing protein [Hoylesella loescheii]
MNKSLLLVLLMTLCSLGLRAQSSMTDLQVMQFVLKEHKAGTSQAQIVTKLMQRGVDIQQIRRVKDAYERVTKNKGLGQVSNGTNKDDKLEDSRMRKNNGENKTDTKNSQMIRSVGQDDHDYPTTHRNAADHGLITHELNEFLPDSATQQERDRLNIYVGRMPKRVFGRDIFNRKDLSFEPNMNIATPQNYRLGPGDAVNIDIYGASQKSEQTTVSPDGDVVIEGFGPVQVSGLTVAEANARLRSTLGSRYSSSRVRLTVGQTRTIMVNVMGEVKRPGTYTLSAFASVFHALYMAGGINDLGTLRNIKVYRQNKLVTVVDIYDYILNGKLTGNVRLADNDVVVVGAYDCLVNLTGKVKRPMYYEMKRSESVGTLLKYAGGFAGDAYTKAVRVVRKTGREYSVFNVDEFDFNTFHLADEDSVSVDSILPRFSNMVEVKGAVFRPGMYQVGGSINSVRTLIEHAEGITEEAFTARAVMHRMRPDRTLEVIPVDVEGIMSGKVADIPLQKNDVLFVPTKGEMMQQQTVTIHGEVMYPGIYKFAANETLEDLVLQAGGLKESASTTKVDVARRIINPKALSTDSVISRTYTFALKDGFVIDGEAGFTLQPFDEVYVRKSPGYNVQKNIAVQGQVMFAGTYTLTSKNERLSDAIKRAGGVTDLAYIRGARLERRITPDERLRMETVLRLAEMQSGKKDSVEKKRLDLGDTYYVGIELEKALAEPGGDADLVLREGDKLIVPEYNGTVKISGNVMYPNTVAYEKGRRPAWYINQAGGFGNRAKKSNTYIIYMNGTVARVGHNAKIRPGCEIVVPTKPEGNGKALTQWLSVGTTVAGLATLIAAIANLIK